MGSQRIGHNYVTNTHIHTHTHTHTSPNKGAEIILWMEGRGSLNKSMEA